MGVCDIIILFLYMFPVVFTFPDQGQWSESYEKVTSVYYGMPKTLYSGSSISVQVNCEPYNTNKKVMLKIGWTLRQTSCFEEYLANDILNPATLKMFYDCPMNPTGTENIRFMNKEFAPIECTSFIHLEFTNSSFVHDVNLSEPSAANCQMRYSDFLESTFKSNSSRIDAVKARLADIFPQKLKNEEQMDEKSFGESGILKRRRKAVMKSGISQKTETSVANVTTQTDIEELDNFKLTPSSLKENAGDKLYNKLQTTLNSSSAILLYKNGHSNVKKPGSKLTTVDMDGVYLFVIKIESPLDEPVNLTIDLSMKGDYGYLSAVDYPLFLFYGYMCGIYVIYACSWFIVSALQWRDLLRIQFWIGAVILLGLIEKAVFYAEYQSINYTGQSVQGAVMFAEILSCLKRTLARMLVIIVSLGFGIVKPRLGPMLHRVVGVGGLYFVLGATEGCLRVLKPKNDPSNQALMAGIPLAVTDSVICWWIFSSLVQTNRTLRLRRNLVKLSLYRHFTNTLIFAVLASVAYMIWSIHSHKLVTCVSDWKELWVDEAYWHLLFSLLLLVIMILWRPTNNNQRYAYTPLLDALDDEDEFDQSLANDAFVGMKMRASKNATSPNEKDIDDKSEDDLKWVEENVPSTFTENAVPSFLDSDEEIMTAKFERNKME